LSKKFSDLTQLTTPATNDILPIDDVSASTTKKITIADLLATTGTVIPESLTTGTGSTWAYASYTPTFVNLTVGNGTLTGKYKQIGKTITGSIDLVWGSTTSLGGAATFTLPVTSVSTYNALHSALGISYFDKPGSEAYGGVTLWASTTTATAFVPNGPADTRLVQMTTGKPIGTPTTGTIFSFQFSYEAA
jgi:hypothetical protein